MQSKLNDWYINQVSGHTLKIKSCWQHSISYNLRQKVTGHTTLQHATGDQLWVTDVVHRSKVTCHRLQATSDLFIVAQIHFLQ